MAITTKPKRKVDLATIDEIQDEMFGFAAEDEDKKKEEEPKSGETGKDGASEENPKETVEKTSVKKTKSARKKEKGSSVVTEKRPRKSAENTSAVKNTASPAANPTSSAGVSPDASIAEMLSAQKYSGVRYKSRPYTVPRSLMADLDRLKLKLRTRDIHLTQNELIDKMIGEALETVNSGNFFELAEKANGFIRSPQLGSRRSVTLTERTVHKMNDLKTEILLETNRKVSAEEIFSALFAVAFLPHYESGAL
jgi:hypothetical protein